MGKQREQKLCGASGEGTGGSRVQDPWGVGDRKAQAWGGGATAGTSGREVRGSSQLICPTTPHLHCCFSHCVSWGGEERGMDKFKRMILQ